MTTLEMVERALAQLVDADGGDPERAGELAREQLLTLADRPPEGEWSDADWALIDQAWTGHVEAHRRQPAGVAGQFGEHG